MNKVGLLKEDTNEINCSKSLTKSLEIWSTKSQKTGSIGTRKSDDERPCNGCDTGRHAPENCWLKHPSKLPKRMKEQQEQKNNAPTTSVENKSKVSKPSQVGAKATKSRFKSNNTNARVAQQIDEDGNEETVN